MFKLLEPVVLKSDVPERGLRKGWLGTVVEVYSPAKVEVEFVTANGRTLALLPLETRELRKATNSDALAVAPAARRRATVIGPFTTPKPAKAAKRMGRQKARVSQSRRSSSGSRRRNTA